MLPDNMRFVIREDALELDALWVKPGSVRSTDIDCTDMSTEQFGELYQSKRDALKSNS